MGTSDFSSKINFTIQILKLQAHCFTFTATDSPCEPVKCSCFCHFLFHPYYQQILPIRSGHTLLKLSDTLSLSSTLLLGAPPLSRCNTPAAPLCLRAIGCFLPWTGTQGEMAYKSSEWSLTERLRLQDGWSFKQVGEWKSVMLWTDVAEHRAGMSCHKKKSYTYRSALHGVKLYFL